MSNVYAELTEAKNTIREQAEEIASEKRTVEDLRSQIILQAEQIERKEFSIEALMINTKGLSDKLQSL